MEPQQSTTILLETMSGKGSEIGRNFEEIQSIIEKVEIKDKIGVCLDTCHVYDAGYDIKNNLDGVLEQFDKIIGLDRLKACHLNDSKNPFESHKDRHEKIGQEKIKTEVGRFRYNCYPMKTEECQRSLLPVSTGWYEIDGTISSLKSATVKHFCENCPLKGVQMFMKKTESKNYNSWRYEWCLVRDEF